MNCSETLLHLRNAANEAANAWPVQRWSKVSGPGPESLEQDAFGNFIGLVLAPGSELRLRCSLTLPERAAGVMLAGDALEATIHSLYPVDLSWNGVSVFTDSGVPVAAGPALVKIIPALQAGENGILDLAIHVPNNQVTLWFAIHLTTPWLRERFEMLDIAWSELALADGLAATPEEKALVERAAQAIPTDLSSFDRGALEGLEQILKPLSARASRLNVHVIGHSHIDMNWLWTWPDTEKVILRDFASVLSLMEDYPEFTFTHSQPATYEVVRQQAPQLFARMLERIRQGRWEAATLNWVEGDKNMAAGEALARHFLESVQYSRQVLGIEPAVMLEPDTFGHAGNLPQLAVSAGARCYYHHRCNPGQEKLWPAYWWEGQDGSRILAVSTQTYNGEIRARDLAETALRAWRHRQADSLHFHGIGDHGGGPSRQNLDALRRFQRHPLLPHSFCSTLGSYSSNILHSGVALPVQRGESRTIFEGCYTTHSDIKRYNRMGENLLVTADTLSALAHLRRSEGLQKAWRSLLFNQFHDILDGSAIHESYAKSAQDFAEISTAARAEIDAALTVLGSGLSTGEIAVTNPCGWEREDWVTAPGKTGQGAVWLVSSSGHCTLGQYTPEGLGFVARLPAFGTMGYRIQGQELVPENLPVSAVYAPTDDRQANVLGPSAQEPPFYKIETPFFRVYVRREAGILVSFYDRRLDRELIGFGMRRATDFGDNARPDLAFNVLQLVEEYPHVGSAWHFDEVYSEYSLIRGATTRLLETGPARLVLETQHTLRDSQITQQIIFYRDLARVDFRTQVDWQEIGGPEKGIPNLKVAFTARLPECEAWYETPFAAARRPGDGQEVPALRWADVGGSEYGFALLNDSRYGYDALGCRLRLTLLRSSYEPDSIPDLGQHEIRYSLVPHAGDWRQAGIVKLGAGFNQPFLAREVQATGNNLHKTWTPRVTGCPSVLISCLKLAHQGNGRVVRLYESAGLSGEAALEGLPDGSRVWETNIVEDRWRELDFSADRVQLAFRPWQVRTLLVEEQPG
ncbi:MAG: alpha-mannosidase [Omnitrophica WOR_2 bacterium]